MTVRPHSAQASQPAAPGQARLPSRFVLGSITSAGLALTLALFGCGGDGDSEGSPTIRVLSSDPNFVSGGDALISVAAPAGGSARDITVTLNGADVTASLELDAQTNSLRGLIEGLNNGANELRAKVSRGGTATLAVKNFPRSGPIFSGPLQKPWACRTEAAGLGAPLDEDCNVEPRYAFFYKSKATGAFASYDPANPPAGTDVESTTTDQNVTVPYIVRQESGTMARVMYRIAVLFDPSKPWSAFAPQGSWNHKLYVPLFGGFAKNYDSGVIAPGAAGYPGGNQDAVLNDMALKRGFAVAKTVFLQPHTHTDPVRAAESLMMLKERIRERYGSIRFTFSSGASGGSFTQNQLANSYPGLLDGIIPMANFIDYWSATDQESHDCTVIRNYYARYPGLWTDAAQRLAVEGTYSAANCDIFSTTFPRALEADGTLTTGISAAAAYDATTNPGGVRQTYQDYHVNYLGRRPASSWSAPERAAGFGFARSHRDNIGIQYGLKALAESKISAEQFVHLNEHMGGLDIDFKNVAQRTVQDAGSAAAMYRTGGINDAKGLDTVAVIAVRLPDPDPVSSHEVIHSFIQRERMARMHGSADNYVLWIIPEYEYQFQHEISFVAMDQWLTAVEADKGSDPLARKIVKNKPSDVTSGCWSPSDAGDVRRGNQVTDLALCTSSWYQVSDTPRTVAAMGSRDATFITKCQLKPLVRTDYDVVFSDAQWARLQAAFPGGVCDWSKPDAGLVESVPWLDYAAGPEGTPIARPATLPMF